MSRRKYATVRLTEQGRITPAKEEHVNHPDWYNRGSVEAIDAMEAAAEGLTGAEAVCTCNAVKYLFRWKDKGGLEDLRKARWYLDRLICTVRKRERDAGERG